MHWIAPTEKDTAAATLEKRLWHATDQFRADSGSKSKVCIGLLLRTTPALRLTCLLLGLIPLPSKEDNVTT